MQYLWSSINHLDMDTVWNKIYLPGGYGLPSCLLTSQINRESQYSSSGREPCSSIGMGQWLSCTVSLRKFLHILHSLKMLRAHFVFDCVFWGILLAIDLPKSSSLRGCSNLWGVSCLIPNKFCVGINSNWERVTSSVPTRPSILLCIYLGDSVNWTD